MSLVGVSRAQNLGNKDAEPDHSPEHSSATKGASNGKTHRMDGLKGGVCDHLGQQEDAFVAGAKVK